MWFEWDWNGEGSICGCCNNGTQGMLINRHQLGGMLLVLLANGLWPSVHLNSHFIEDVGDGLESCL